MTHSFWGNFHHGMIPDCLKDKFQWALCCARQILLVSDQHADGDSMGSITALAGLLRQSYKQHALFVELPLPSHLKFLPEAERVIIGLRNLHREQFDVIITCDFSDIEQSGIPQLNSQERRRRNQLLINIDHHQTNTNFGDINIVIPSACATTEIVYELFQACGYTIDNNIATSLLLGLVTDTGYFSNRATSPTTLQAASTLLRAGARLEQIFLHTWKNQSLAALKCIGKILNNIQVNAHYSTAVAVVPEQQLQERDIDQDAFLCVANLLNSLSTTKLAIVLKEKDAVVKGSLRTTNDDVNVARIASFFGGGGHQRAAGFRISGGLSKTVNGWRIL